MSRAVYQRRTVTCLATLTESDCTVVLQQKCDNATLIILISTSTTNTNYHIVMKWSLAAGIGMEIIMFLYITGDITELFNLLGLLRIIFL